MGREEDRAWAAASLLDPEPGALLPPPSLSSRCLAPSARRVLGIGNCRKAGSPPFSCCAGSAQSLFESSSESCQQQQGGWEAKGEWRMLCLSSESGSFIVWWALGADRHFVVLSDAQFVKILVSGPLAKFLQVWKLLTFQRYLKLFQFGADIHREAKGTSLTQSYSLAKLYVSTSKHEVFLQSKAAYFLFGLALRSVWMVLVENVKTLKQKHRTRQKKKQPEADTWHGLCSTQAVKFGKVISKWSQYIVHRHTWTVSSSAVISLCSTWHLPRW